TPRAHFDLLLKGALKPKLDEDECEQPVSPESLTGGIDHSGESGIAFLFGCERYGMANEDVYRCNVALSIPTNPQFGSLNLASAVQVVAYDWRQALGGYGVQD